MQSLFLTGVFAALMFAGFSTAFIAALGFIWVDIVRPQHLAYSIINDMPLSFIAAVLTLTLFILKDRKYLPKFGVLLFLLVLFTIWVTFTAYLSDFPVQAWSKWDWASKVLIFAVVMPYIFRSRIQIEAFILTFVFGACTIVVPAGMKTLLGGGGYQSLSIMGTGNSGLSESSTLAVVCVMMIPLVLVLLRHSLVFPKNILTRGLFIGIIFMAFAAVVGTGARTGIIAIVVMVMLSMLQSKKKLWWLAGIAVVAVVLLNLDLSATQWGSRMSTIETYNSDSSALGRIRVWEWTLDYVAGHPLGGGFNSFLHNRIAAVSPDGSVLYYPEGVAGGKAFHSIYFELLGEQGFFGFGIYFAIIAIMVFKLIKLRNTWRNHAGMGWLSDLANAMLTGVMVFLAGGAFVGIAYQPFIFYMISLTVAIDQYAVRVQRDQLEARKRAIA